MAETAYTAKDITVLEGLEPVRLRPGMYIGSTGPRGLHHLVYEVVDNSVDEALAGHATRIDVTLLPDGGCRVVDDDGGQVGGSAAQDRGRPGRAGVGGEVVTVHALTGDRHEQPALLRRAGVDERSTGHSGLAVGHSPDDVGDLGQGHLDHALLPGRSAPS